METLAVAAPAYPDQLDELVRRVQAYNPQADTALIRRAYDYSARMHVEQKRKSGEPYVIHPLNVALIIAQLRMDLPSVVTGLLHDVIEDTGASLNEVQGLFGEEVARLVDGMTKVSKITFSSREEKQAENFRKMIIAMAHDIRVVLIKLADRLHNMRTLDHLSPDRQEEISRETLEIYAPIAHRLGIYWLKSELEDFSFRYLNPSAYATLKAYVAKTRGEREEYIKSVLEILSRRLKESGVEAEVTGRPKHFFSIHSKMQQEELNFDQIYDLVAFRIIVPTLRECYEALGRCSRELEADTRALQGLYRAAQGQHVPVAALDHNRTARAADGGADSHPRDARSCRTRNRRSLELQGGRGWGAAIARHRTLRLAAAVDRMAAES